MVRAKARIVTLIALDAVLVNIALLLALFLRFEMNIPAQYLGEYYRLAPAFTVAAVGSFYFFGLYRKLWQYASIGEVLVILNAVTVATALQVTGSFLFQDALPRSVYILCWGLMVAMIGGIRFCWRIYRDGLAVTQPRGDKPILIVGAGDAGAMVARELKNRSHGNGYRIVGFIDDAALKQGQSLLGVKVVGNRADLPRLVRRHGVREVVLAMPSATGTMVRELMDQCRLLGVGLRTVPALYELVDGRVSVSKLREVRLEDLLRRDPIEVNLEEMSGYLRGKAVLVTGAGGSIGSELCRQVARLKPEMLVLLDHSENSLYDMEQELRRVFPELKFELVVVDVKDRAKVERVFSRYRPQVVFHAAAHKHVPLMECNSDEAVKNNIIGTRCVAEAADRCGTQVFILISTDKAVNPTSVMGASKRAAERLVQHFAKRSKTTFAAVRFGNVLGSRGSVVPLFQEQIALGGPVTVTHPEMKRYFMTIPEAVQLVVQAGAMARGGEVFVLDMGEQVKIVDMARSLIELSGLEPGKDIEIVFTGIRPGEKLYEELLTAEEGVDATRHRRIFVAKANGMDEVTMEQLLFRLQQRGFPHDEEEAMDLLRAMVPSFRRMEKSKATLEAAASRRLIADT